MENKDKMGRKLNMDELEQVTGGTDPNINNYFTNEDPAKFVENQIQRDESARLREEIANGKDFKTL